MRNKIFAYIRRSVFFLLALAILLPGMARSAAAQAGGAGETDAPVGVYVPPPYPRTYEFKTGGVVTIYAPQIESWEDQARMVAYFAVAFQPKAAKEPVFGSVKLEADTAVSIDRRVVRFSDYTISEVSFPSLSKEELRNLTEGLQLELPESGRTLSLDTVLAAVDRSRLIIKAGTEAELKSDPPLVFHSSSPAVMVGFDGEPVWSPIRDVDLKFAVNTNWDIFQDTTSSVYYLRVDESWLSSTDLKSGWKPAGSLPASFSKLPADDNWKDVRASLPGKKLSPGKAPKVFVSNVPAELIVVDGAPKYTAVAGTSLLWLSNTENDVFRNGAKGEIYYLVAGRWFSAPGLDGPWKFATPTLPDDFKKIPLEHPRSRVLASVPGTQQATEAILQASIPRTARVNKNELKAPEVAFQGDPVFKAIDGTQLSLAVNTDKDIIKFGDDYYLCYQAVWFISKSASGPWSVATDIPAEIYTIPTSSPAHHVTYVTVKEESKSSNWVVYTYYPGYTGMMIGYGTVVWGTGWYYPPYIYYGPYYPIYYPYYRTYGYAAWYNPYTGNYGRGMAAYGPYGGAGFGAVYNPSTGTYARGGIAYGPYSTRSFAQAYNPRTGTYAQTRQGNTVYGSWGTSFVERGDSWVQTGRVTDRQTGNTVGGIRTSGGGAAIGGSGDNGRGVIGRTGSGDVYAGRDGNVFRRTDGGWQKYDGGSWNPVATPVNPGQNRNRPSTNVDRSTYDYLNRERKARNDANYWSREASTYRLNMGGMSSAGSYRRSAAPIRRVRRN
jgi:hypothetical protein